MGKILNDFLILTGLRSLDEPSDADYARYNRAVKYFEEKGLSYDVGVLGLKEVDRVYMKSL